MRKTLYLENPTKQELYDTLQFARGKYKQVIAHGKKFKSEWGVKRKVFKVMPETDILGYSQL